MRKIFSILLLFATTLFGEGHTINFKNVSALEFVKFVSRISETNFIFDEGDLNFEVSLISGRPATPSNILSALQQILEKNNIVMEKEEDYYHLKKMDVLELKAMKERHALESTKLAALIDEKKGRAPSPFHVYKLQYNEGNDILTALKQVANSEASDELRSSINSLQYIKSTNSLLYTGGAITELTALISSLDQPQKQVFIEVLVIETSVKDGLDFGLEWAGKAKYRDQFGGAIGNFQPSKGKNFAKEFHKVGPNGAPSGNSIPYGHGFDLGVIGDIILHKGKTFFTLGSLVSALQRDQNTTIVLNQRILTQDNKPSNIFVGSNIPFTGSVVETIGASQQTASNVEYRDVGVSLKITPLLGNGDVITLDIAQEISDAREDLQQTNQQLGGILTSKTNMMTRAHVPDEHFLVLSGMVHNTKVQQKSGVPCLGGLPFIGAAFSKTTTRQEKKNIIVFVRPQIVNTIAEIRHVTDAEARKQPNQELVKDVYSESQ